MTTYSTPQPVDDRPDLRVRSASTRPELHQRLLVLECRSACRRVVRDSDVADLQAIVAAAPSRDLSARAELLLATSAMERGELVAAAAALRRVREWARAEGDAGVLADTHRLISVLLRAVGDAAGMLSHANEALTVLEPQGGPWWRRAAILCALGIALDLTGSWPEAQSRYQDAMALAGPSPQLMLTLLNDLAYGHCLRGELEPAREYAGRMLELTQNGAATLLAANYDTLACMAMLGGDLELAAEHAHHGLETQATQQRAIVSEPDSMLACRLRLAEIRRRSGDYAAATAALEQCIREATAASVAWVVHGALLERAELAAAQGDFRAAYEAHKRYHETWKQGQEERRQLQSEVLAALNGTRED